jgi:signal transduction histidine kinase
METNRSPADDGIEPRPDAGRRPERDWIPAIAFAFVLAALVALAATPVLLQRSLAQTTRELTGTLLPAYEALRDVAFAMEQRVAASRSRFLTGNRMYESQLADATVAEAAALAKLDALAPRLGREARMQIAEVRRLAARRDSLERALIAGGREIEEYRSALPQFEALRDSLLQPLAALRANVMRVTEAKAIGEARSGRLQRSVSVVLALLALVAAALVGWFARQQRDHRRVVQRALDEANRQRAMAEQRKADLERATESRVRLLRGITHDVKNPLGAARGYADLLQLGVKGPVPPEQAPLIAGIRRSVDGALTMIGDLLDLARADSGGLSVRARRLDIADLVRTSVADHRAAAEAAGHRLEVELPPGEMEAETDGARVAEIVGNLLSNAIKYTPAPGRITVSCALAPRDTDAREGIVIRVRDTGPGIPVSKREAIFDEFTRLHDDGRHQGHGLGLAIARRIARLLGGELGVATDEAPGATFELWLPRSMTPSEAGDRVARA